MATYPVEDRDRDIVLPKEAVLDLIETRKSFLRICANDISKCISDLEDAERNPNKYSEKKVDDIRGLLAICRKVLAENMRLRRLFRDNYPGTVPTHYDPDVN